MSMVIYVNETSSSYRIRIMADDTDEFFAALEKFKQGLPASARRYDPDGRVWQVKRRASHQLEAWLRQMRWQGTEVVEIESAEYEQEQGSNPYPRPEYLDPLEAAYETLHLLPSAPMKLVETARRLLLAHRHPDVGGDHEEAVRINNAFDLIRADREGRRRGAA